MNTIGDEKPEPYLLRGKWKYRSRAVWHHAIQRWALVVAEQLDDWRKDHFESDCEIANNPGFQFRQYPPTLINVALAVLPKRLPTFESDWVSGLPSVVVEIMDGPELYSDLYERSAEYLACGVSVVWVLTPDFRTITIHRQSTPALALDARDTLSGDPELPGFSCPVADFFR